jgi:tRNA splicing endonuclease
MKEPQKITIPVTFVFKAEHSPDSDFMLRHVVYEYLRSKGVVLEGDRINV